jgi:hypothetical protein
MLHTALTLIGFVRGLAVSLEPEAQAQQDTGLTNDEWMAAQDRQLREIFASGRFPMLARISTGPDIDGNLDSLFEFGLDQLLDGLAARVSSAAAGSTTAPARPRPARVPRRPARTTP